MSPVCETIYWIDVAYDYLVEVGLEKYVRPTISSFEENAREVSCIIRDNPSCRAFISLMQEMIKSFGDQIIDHAIKYRMKKIGTMRPKADEARDSTGCHTSFDSSTNCGQFEAQARP